MCVLEEFFGGHHTWQGDESKVGSQKFTQSLTKGELCFSDRVKKDVQISFFFFLFFQILFFNSCVLGFSNAQNHIPKAYANVYVPAAEDHSSGSGNSSRLTAAVRYELAQRSDLNLVDAEKATWALQMIILTRTQSINSLDQCIDASGYPNVGSGAFSCGLIHPELSLPTGYNSANTPTSFNQPSSSPSKETLVLGVVVRAIDLNTGKILWKKSYSSGSTFDEIGETDDRTKNQMQNTPDLHALRYQESVDNAVESVANSIAADVMGGVFSLPSP